MLLLPLLAIAGIFLAIHLRFRQPVEFALFATICTVDAIVYVVAQCGALRPGCLALTGIGLICLVVSITRIVVWVPCRLAARELLSPGIVVFLVGMCCFWVSYHDIRLHVSGEFRHWGLASKYLLTTHQLWRRGGAIELADYPPGAALFHYFVSFMAPYRESHLYLAQAILTFSPISVLFAGSSWRRPHWILLSVVTVLLAVCLFDSYCFPSLLVDTQVGIQFGMVVLSQLLLPRSPSRSRLLFYVPILFVMPLTKEIGLVFAGFALILHALDLRRGRWVCYGILLVSVALSQASWTLRNRILGSGSTVAFSKIGWPELKRAFSTDSVPIEIKMRGLFLRAIRETPIVWTDHERRLLPRPMAKALPRMNLIAWGLLLTALSGVTLPWIADRETRQRQLVLTISIIPFLCTYLLIHYLIYMFVFVHMVSSWWPLEGFERYMGIFLVGVFLAVVGSLHRAGQGHGAGTLLLCLVLPVAIFCNESPPLVFLQSHSYPAADGALRRGIYEVGAHVPADGHVAMVCMGRRTGWDHLIPRYELLPRVIDGPWVDGLVLPASPSALEPLTTASLSPSAWVAEIKKRGDGFVWVSSGSPKFYEECGTLFAPERRQDDVLFRVLETDGPASLVPLPSSLWCGSLASGEARKPSGDPSHPAPMTDAVFRPETTEWFWRTGSEVLKAAESSIGWGVGPKGGAFPSAPNRPLGFVCDVPFQIRRGEVEVVLVNWVDSSSTLVRLEVSGDGKRYLPLANQQIPATETRAEWSLPTGACVGDHLWIRLAIDRSVPDIGVQAMRIRLSGLAIERSAGEEARIRGREGPLVVVPAETFVNDSTVVRVRNDGRSEVTAECADGHRLVATAGTASSWKVGYQGIAFGPAPENPLTLSFVSPLPLDSATLRLGLENYDQNQGALRLRVEVRDTDTGRADIEELRVASPRGEVQKTFDRQIRGCRRIQVSILMNRTDFYTGIGSMNVVLRGSWDKAAWDPWDPSLLFENSMREPLSVDVYPAREE